MEYFRSQAVIGENMGTINVSDEQELLLWRSGLVVENVDLNTMYICSYHREYYSDHNQVRCCDPFLSHANIEGVTRKKKVPNLRKR